MIKRILSYLTIGFYCFSISILAQYQNVMVGNAINQYEPNEPSIVINPYNTNHILVGANTDNYYYSIDGGMNWQHGVLASSFGVAGDPCVLAYEDGYYYFHLVPDLSRVVCQKTSSFSGVWSNGSYTGLNGNKENDKEWAVVNQNDGSVYVTWAQFDDHGSINQEDSSEIQLSRSTDGGITWATPVVISDRKGNAQAGNYSDHSPMPAIGPNNEVYVAWWSPEGLMFDKSTDGGITWPEDDINVSGFHIDWLVFNVPGVPIVPGFPIINCDLSSGEDSGNIYICWTDSRSGYQDTDVWLVKSTDNGINWSDPIRVNNDPPGKHQFFAWITIDQTNGNLYFLFYDRRNYTNLQTDVYMAVSRDGGDSFINFKVSESPFTPSQYNFLGHYIGVSAHNNIVRPVWTRFDNNFPSLWTALVDSVTSVEEYPEQSEVLNYTLFQNFPNPFNPKTVIRYQLPVTSNVTLKIYDLLGSEVATLVNEEKATGTYEINFDASVLTSGVYLYRLTAGIFTEMRKMILIK